MRMFLCTVAVIILIYTSCNSSVKSDNELRCDVLDLSGHLVRVFGFSKEDYDSVLIVAYYDQNNIVISEKIDLGKVWFEETLERDFTLPAGISSEMNIEFNFGDEKFLVHDISIQAGYTVEDDMTKTPSCWIQEFKVNNNGCKGGNIFVRKSHL